jgi:hypothetical protein
MERTNITDTRINAFMAITDIRGELYSINVLMDRPDILDKQYYYNHGQD